MYLISVMIFTFSIRDSEHPKLLKSQFGHPVMEILAKSLYGTFRDELWAWMGHCKEVGSENNRKPTPPTLPCESIHWTNPYAAGD